MDRNKVYDLICIGNYTKDTIITPSGTRYVDGGAINYSAHVANKLGLKVAVVTRLAKDDQRVVDKFKSAGIDCFPTYTSSSTLMKLEYPTHDPDLRYLSVADTAGTITSHDIEGLQTRAALIGTSFRGEIDQQVIHLLKQKDLLLGADMQGFVRVLRDENLNYEPWEEMEQILPYLDVLKTDAVEAEQLTGESDIYKAAKLFARLGADEIVLTHRDGLLIYAGGDFAAVEFYPENLVGRSGRGDTCIGAYMAMRLSHDPYAAMLWAAAVTSLKMERLGPFDRSMREVELLLADKYHYNHFEPAQ